MSHVAEAVRFELTVPCETPVFKTGALNHYATPPHSAGHYGAILLVFFHDFHFVFPRD